MPQETNYGNCNYCNAPKVRNPKTGKIFCSEKCWLKNAPETPPPSTTGNSAPDWQKPLKSPITAPQVPNNASVMIADELRAMNEKLDSILEILQQNIGGE